MASPIYPDYGSTWRGATEEAPLPAPEEPKKKKNQIVILGRIVPNKSIDESIRIFAEGTKNNQSYNLVMLGGNTAETERYIHRLNKIIKNYKLEKRVKIIRDPSFKEIRNTLSESRLLIDSQRNVSLNMTSIEAMSSGCIILSQKNAGTYLEVLDQGRFGFGFSDIKQGSEKLKEILGDTNKASINKEKAIERAKFFSPKKFKERLNKILENG